MQKFWAANVLMETIIFPIKTLVELFYILYTLHFYPILMKRSFADEATAWDFCKLGCASSMCNNMKTSKPNWETSLVDKKYSTIFAAILILTMETNFSFCESHQLIWKLKIHLKYKYFFSIYKRGLCYWKIILQRWIGNVVNDSSFCKATRPFTTSFYLS